MKRESVLEHLKSVQEGEDPSEFLDWIMGENGADIVREKSAAKDARSEVKGLKEQLASLQSQIDEANLSKMTEEEQLAKARADYEEKLSALNVQSNRIDAKKSLTDAGLTLDEADSLLDRIVTADAKETSETVSALLSVLDSRREAVETATKQAMLQSTPKPTGSTGSDSKANVQAAYEQASSRNDLVGMAAAIRNGFEQQQVQ